MFLGSEIFRPGGWQRSVTKEEALKLFLILIGTPLNQRLQILAERTETHHTNTQTCTHTRIHTHTLKHAHTHTQTCTYTHTLKHAQTHTLKHAHTHTHTLKHAHVRTTMTPPLQKKIANMAQQDKRTIK